QGVWPGITLVLGQEQPRPAARDRHERGHARLEAVFPLLGETQALVPGDRLGGVSGAQDRDDFLVHAGMVSQTCAGLAGLAGRASLGSALTTVAPSLKPTAARSGQLQAGALEPPLGGPLFLRRVLRGCP